MSQTAAPKTRAKPGRKKGSRDRKTAPRKARKAANALKALELRCKGLTIAKIAAEINLSPSHVTELIQDAMGKQVSEAADEAKALDLMRLDEMFQNVYEAAKTGDLEAIQGAMSIMGRRARLLGYDAPVKVDPGKTAAQVQVFISAEEAKV